MIPQHIPDYHSLNPNNPVARASNGQWHKLCALVMYKLGVSHVEITEEDAAKFASEYANIGIADNKGHVEVFLLTKEESEAALKKHGGMPHQS